MEPPGEPAHLGPPYFDDVEWGCSPVCMFIAEATVKESVGMSKFRRTAAASVVATAAALLFGVGSAGAATPVAAPSVSASSLAPAQGTSGDGTGSGGGAAPGGTGGSSGGLLGGVTGLLHRLLGLVGI